MNLPKDDHRNMVEMPVSDIAPETAALKNQMAQMSVKITVLHNEVEDQEGWA